MPNHLVIVLYVLLVLT